MKISKFILSVSGFCIFYITYADWIDELYDTLVEDYLGSDYEEVAPFVNSVASGTEEFDSIVEQLSKTQTTTPTSYVVVSGLISLTLILLAIRFLFFGKRTCQELLKKSQEILKCSKFVQKSGRLSSTDIGKLVGGIFSKKPRKLLGTTKKEDESVQVIWKGNHLMESSMHCNLRDEACDGKVLRDTINGSGKVGIKSSDLGGGDDELTPSSSKESTMQRIAEIRKLLESEPEIIQKIVDKCSLTEEFSGPKMTELRQRLESDVSIAGEETKVKGNAPSQPSATASSQRPSSSRRTYRKSVHRRPSIEEESKDHGTEIKDSDHNLDPKLMNRIRLLESRLRLEELRNRNWISRMSKAEGMLQQLNKQVERIEQGPQMETLTETLKITSTVINWMPMTPPKKNIQYSVVRRHPLQYLQPPYESLSDIVKREVPMSYGHVKRLINLQKSPLVPALPPPMVTPQNSFISKFLSK